MASEPTYPGCIVPARIIGYLKMIDDGKEDYKIISVVDCDPRYDDVNSLEDISKFTLKEIKNFFENYKKLQHVKVEIGKYYSKEEALAVLEKCRSNYKDQK